MNKDVIPLEVRKHKLVANVRKMTQDEDCIIGVSGGADSMALLALATAAMMQESASFQVTVAHVHHGLRDASDDELKKDFIRVITLYQNVWKRQNNLLEKQGIDKAKTKLNIEMEIQS